MAVNKAEAKLGPKFLWWINKANQRVSFTRPPCYLFWWERNWRSRLKSMIIHFFHCVKYPPHKVGEMVDDSVLESRFGEKALLKEYEKTFGHPYDQPIK